VAGAHAIQIIVTVLLVATLAAVFVVAIPDMSQNPLPHRTQRAREFPR